MEVLPPPKCGHRDSWHHFSGSRRRCSCPPADDITQRSDKPEILPGAITSDCHDKSDMPKCMPLHQQSRRVTVTTRTVYSSLLPTPPQLLPMSKSPAESPRLASLPPMQPLLESLPVEASVPSPLQLRLPLSSPMLPLLPSESLPPLQAPF